METFLQILWIVLGVLGFLAVCYVTASAIWVWRGLRRLRKYSDEVRKRQSQYPSCK